jgi:hypothetical protein
MPLSSTQKARIYAVSYCAYHFGILEQGTYACNDMHIILFGFDPCAGEVFPFSAYTCIPYPHEHVLKVKSLYLEIDEATMGLFALFPQLDAPRHRLRRKCGARFQCHTSGEKQHGNKLARGCEACGVPQVWKHTKRAPKARCGEEENQTRPIDGRV